MYLTTGESPMQNQQTVTVEEIRENAEEVIAWRGQSGCFVVNPPLKAVCVTAIIDAISSTIILKVGDVVDIRKFGQHGKFRNMVHTSRSDCWLSMKNFKLVTK